MISAILGGVTLPPFTTPFTETPLEVSGDIVTLDGTTYTDYTAQRRELEINWSDLTLADYEAIRGIYDEQFINNVYPLFTCSYYSMSSEPVRMYINARDVRVNGCQVYDVTIKLVQQTAIIVRVS